MNWNKYKIKTTTEATELVCAVLYSLGITGVEIEDNVQLTEEEKKAQFIDYLADLPDDDGTASVIFYTEEGGDDDKLLDTIREELLNSKEFADIGEGSITKEISREDDWADNWKEFFKPFSVSGFYVKPTWEEADAADGLKVIEIDPGRAFGTGRHETTKLCIGQLSKYVKENDSVLDLGCGSAILSIAAKKLGAGRIVMTDIDEIAVESAKDNMLLNNISENEFEVLLGNVLEDTAMQDKLSDEKFDIVVANILADVIEPLCAVVHKFLKLGGIFISSGIIYMKEENITKAVDANDRLTIIGIEKMGDWRSVIAKCEG